MKSLQPLPIVSVNGVWKQNYQKLKIKQQIRLYQENVSKMQVLVATL